MKPLYRLLSALSAFAAVVFATRFAFGRGAAGVPGRKQ